MILHQGKEMHADSDGVLSEHPTGLLEMTNEVYQSSPGISKTQLATIKEGDFAYWRDYEDPERPPREETEDLKLGTAIHSGVLEPNEFEKNYVASPEFNMRSNAGKAEFKAFCDDNPGKIILKPDSWDMALRVRDAVLAHPVAGPLFTGGKAEQTFFAHDPETGALIKCRFDFLQDGGVMAVDLKSVREGGASKEGFAREAATHDYMMQPPWYFRVLQTLYGKTPSYWVFVAAEKARRPQIGIYTVKPSMPAYQLAAEANDRYFKRILLCRRERSWPDYGCDPQPLEMPGYWKP